MVAAPTGSDRSRTCLARSSPRARTRPAAAPTAGAMPRPACASVKVALVSATTRSASQDQLQAAGGAGAVDRGDDRPGRGSQPGHQGGQGLDHGGQEPVAAVRLGQHGPEEAQVGAGAEGRPGPGQDQHPHLVVGLGQVQGVVGLGQHRGGERVALGRAVQRDPGGRAPALVAELGFAGHAGGPIFRAAGHGFSRWDGIAAVRERRYSPSPLAWGSGRVEAATPAPSSPTTTKFSALRLGSSYRRTSR